MEAFWLSTGVIFVAELGDKSQLMALAFATRFKATQVLIGIAVATALVHAFSVLVGGLMAVNNQGGQHHRRTSLLRLRRMDDQRRLPHRGRRGQGHTSLPVPDDGGRDRLLPGRTW